MAAVVGWVATLARQSVPTTGVVRGSRLVDQAGVAITGSYGASQVHRSALVLPIDTLLAADPLRDVFADVGKLYPAPPQASA